MRSLISPPDFRRTLQVAAALAGLLNLAPASATIVTVGCSASDWCTLAELESSTAYINVNGLVFSHFTHHFSSALGADRIRVSAGELTDPALIGTFAQLRFQAFDPDFNPWSVKLSPLDSAGSFFGEVSYNAAVLSGLQIGRTAFDTTFIEQVAAGFSSNLGAEEVLDLVDGSQRVLKTACADVSPAGSCNGETDSDVYTFGEQNLQYFMKVTNQVHGSVSRFNNGSVYAGINNLENTFYRQTPEPGTLALAVVALLGAGAVGGQKKLRRS
jgi:hypothetical protein